MKILTHLCGLIAVLFILPSTLFSASAQDCEKATVLVIRAFDLGQFPTAYPEQKRLLHQALSLCPEHPEAHNNLASILEQEARYKEALFHYQKAVDARADFAEAWFGMGEVYYKSGKFTLSLEAYLKACKTDKDARKRVRDLLNSHRYRVSEKGEILDKESLLLLFDKKRRADINQMIASCGFKAEVQPVFVFRNILFDLNRASLKAESLRQLKEIGAALLEVGDTGVLISGHTDSQPFKGVSQEESDKLNLRLSRKRADTVAHQLERMGIALKRIETKGYGPTIPEVSGDTPEAHAKNRRVTIEVVER